MQVEIKEDDYLFRFLKEFYEKIFVELRGENVSYAEFLRNTLFLGAREHVRWMFSSGYQEEMSPWNDITEMIIKGYSRELRDIVAERRDELRERGYG